MSSAGDDLRLPALGIVADDLTGAGDCAVKFAEAGWRVELDVGGRVAPLVPGEAVAMTTDARPLSETDASSRTSAAVTELLRAGAERAYLKIDSTLRGSVRGQIEGALAAWSAAEPGAFALVCPAYPAMGRTVVDGELRVNGEPPAPRSSEAGSDPIRWSSEAGSDPTRWSSEAGSDRLRWSSRPRSGRIETLLAESTVSIRRFAATRPAEGGGAAATRPAEGVGAAVERDTRRMREAARLARVLLVDAASDAELDHLAAVIEGLGRLVLPVGSAGLAAAIARRARRAVAGDLPAPVRPAHASALVAVSSKHPISTAQLDVLLREWGSDARVRIVTTPAEQSAAPGDPRSARGVADRLAADVEQLLAEGPAESLVLVGGDGALAVLKRLGAGAVRVRGSAAEGVPLGVVRGGALDGVTVLTKSGGFGEPETLHELVRALIAAEENAEENAAPDAPQPRETTEQDTP